MTYWFMKMKQGAEGQDFARELWQQGLVGVLFGTWRIDHVLGEDDRPDPGKLTAEAIEKMCRQPKGIDKGRDFNDAFLWAPKTFLLKVSEGDRVVVAFDDIIGIGTVDDGFCDDPNGFRGPFKEQFKCRPVKDQRTFRVAELPASYRLLAGMGY